MLAPGAKAPSLPQLAGAPAAGRRLVLLFLPASAADEVLAGLASFEERLPALADQGAEVMGVSGAGSEELQALRQRLGLRFELMSDPGQNVAMAYDVISPAGAAGPAAYVVDETGVIRTVYAAERYPGFPNPAAVVRALRKLNDSPRPAPVGAEDWQRGPHDAAVELIEYGDYQCSHCRTMHALLSGALRSYAGQFRLVFRHLPLRTTHPLAQQAAEAAEAAGAQGFFWPMHDLLFAAAPAALERQHLLEYAAGLGLDMDRFIAELDGRAHQEAVNEDFRRAVAGGIKLPPQLFVNGVLYDGPRTEAELAPRIKAVLTA